MNAPTAPNQAERTGTRRFLLTWCQNLENGTAPSRENA